MIIVLDTNILYKSPFKNPSFMALFDLLLRSENDTLVIPQLVIDEAVNKCREALGEIRLGLEHQSREFQKWTGEKLSLSLINDKIEDTIAAYEQTLRQTLRQVGAIICPYPKTSHEQLVAKCLSRRKPFSENGQNGYRDALIWESILEILVEDNVTFITQNSKDFFEKDKQALHPHLLEELRQHNIDANQITVFKNLHNFAADYVKPTMEKLDLESVRNNLSFGIGRYDKEIIVDAILQALLSFDYEDKIQPHEIDLPSGANTIHVSSVEDLSDLYITDAHKLASGTWLIDAVAMAYYQFDFFLFKGDWYAMEEDDPIKIIDTDWSDSSVLAETTKLIQVSFTFTFDASTGTIISVEVSALA